jgi:hypothetical protein
VPADRVVNTRDAQGLLDWVASRRGG